MVQGRISTQCFEKQIIDFFNVEPTSLQYRINIPDDITKKLYWICESQITLNVNNKKKIFLELKIKNQRYYLDDSSNCRHVINFYKTRIWVLGNFTIITLMIICYLLVSDDSCSNVISANAISDHCKPQPSGNVIDAI